MIEKRHAEQRGTANFGWLNSKHSFSFGSYYDPQQNGFSDLLVINDDTVAPGGGFDAHPHQDMEIFSYVLDGALEHKDSMGIGSVIQVGDVQAMSAGTGVVHSEFNHSSSAAVHFLQIWIVPAQRRVQPRYQQRHFTSDEKRGKLRLIISPDAAEDSLAVWQDVRVYAGLFDGTETASLTLPPNRHAYVHIARGAVTVNGERLKEGDGARLRNVEQITIADGKEAEVLVFDLRPHELPRM